MIDDLEIQAMGQSYDATLLSHSTANAVQMAARQNASLRRAYEARKAENAHDPALTTEGKMGRLGEVKKTFAERLRNEVKPLLERIAADIDTLERRRQPPIASGDPIVRELRAREIRDAARALDPLEFSAMLLETAQRGDSAFVDAVADTPFRQLVDAAAVSVARRALQVTMYPEISRELRESVRAYTALMLMVEDFERELNATPDPIKEIATGPLLAVRDPAVDFGVRRVSEFHEGDDPE